MSTCHASRAVAVLDMNHIQERAPSQRPPKGYSRGVQLGRGNSHELVYFTALAARAEACPITMHGARDAYVRAGMFSTYTLSKKPITLGKSKQKTKQKETIKKKKDKVDDICWSCDKAVCELLAAPHASPGRPPLPPLRVPSSLTSLREHYRVSDKRPNQQEWLRTALRNSAALLWISVTRRICLYNVSIIK